MKRHVIKTWCPECFPQKDFDHLPGDCPNRPITMRFRELTPEEADAFNERTEAIEEALKEARAKKYGKKGRLI